MSEPTRKPQRIRIRKGGFREELYLSRKGTWGKWRDAAVFSSQQAADRFAEKHGITDHGLF
ncbi:MAG: hypothetical protein IH899_03395 [Planctomycetes bacterium]|nr:hypothetical protein [Planctomycetota bacterium]